MILRITFSETPVLSMALNLRYPYLPLDAANASASSQTAPAFRLRRGEGLLDWLAFLFLGYNAAIPLLRYAFTLYLVKSAFRD